MASYNFIMTSVTGPCRACLASIQNSDYHLVNENTPLLHRHPYPRNQKCAILLFGILMLILFVGCTIGFYLIVVETRDIEPEEVMYFSSRHNWKAKPSNDTKDLILPTQKLFLLFTNSSPCFTYQKCKEGMKNLQKEFINKNLTDLPYNFVIAGDNRIYEGTGKKYLPNVEGYGDNSTTSIAFLDYSTNSNLSLPEIEQLMLLLNSLIAKHKLVKCFNILTRPEENKVLKNIIEKINTTVKPKCL